MPRPSSPCRATLAFVAFLSASSGSLAITCPPDVQDQTLYYLDANHQAKALPQDVTISDIAINLPLSMFYVVSKAAGAPDTGAILVKRLYQIPDDWADGDGKIVMRRRREREQPADAALYDNYHRDVTVNIPLIRNQFHTSYVEEPDGRLGRTDDSALKREPFRYNSRFTRDKRMLAKPLVMTWEGLAADPYCLDFNLNEKGGRFGMIEVYIYELQPRLPPETADGVAGEQSGDTAGDEFAPLNTVHVKLTKTYE